MLWLVNGELANIVFFFIVVVVFLVSCGFIYGIYDSNEYIVRCSEPFVVTVCESNFLAMDDFHLVIRDRCCICRAWLIHVFVICSLVCVCAFHDSCSW